MGFVVLFVSLWVCFDCWFSCLVLVGLVVRLCGFEFASWDLFVSGWVGWFDWFSMTVCLGVLVWVFGLGWLLLCWLMLCVGCVD